MFNEKDILARLQNGEDAMAIADEIALMLNSANNTYLAQKKAEEEAKKKAEEEAEAKRKNEDAITNEIASAVMEYIELAAPDLVLEDGDALDGADVRKFLDSMIPLISILKELDMDKDDIAIRKFLNKNLF